MQDFCIHISTLNGTGSYSANQILTRMIFRSGWPVGSYNFFPSNIAGLPCFYTLRINSQGHTGYKSCGNILVQLNPKTLSEDLKKLDPSGVLVTDETDLISIDLKNFKGHHLSLPFTKVTTSFKKTTAKTKKFLRNTMYLGLISEWLNLDSKNSKKTLCDSFSNKEMAQNNLKAFEWGQEMAQSHPLSFSLIPPPPSQKESLLMEGNEALALGALFAGCQFLPWYPITPASSIAEHFEKWAELYQKDKQGHKKFVVHQSEDEISALNQVIGAGWTGLRSLTVTSGPGLSLMNEAAGLSYFAEVPTVLCNVQRAGPSTGLPTRTQQGDLLSSCFLSHGDTKHIVLMPGNLEESFSFMKEAFELADQLQTLVIVLTDLDLGMNLQMGRPFSFPQKIWKGKILSEKELEEQTFHRYQDKDQDGISYRVLPGTAHPQGAYFTRGSGHNEKAEYSEQPENHQYILDKLKRKWETAKTRMPPSVEEQEHQTPYAFVTFGNNEKPCKEARVRLEEEGIKTNFLRIRSYPFPPSLKDFLKSHLQIFVLEQNREGQLSFLLKAEFPEQKTQMTSLLKYNGMPFSAEEIYTNFKKLKKEWSVESS